ncbi:MAG: hypothetical protein OCU17_05020 [Methanophagales archaeon]|nr:hypothetical protein [Methanophagales archaeon]
MVLNGMAYFFIGIGSSGTAILNSVLEYKEIRRDKPIVIRLRSDKEWNKARISREKGADFAFVISELDDGDEISRAAAMLSESGIKMLFVGVLPAMRRQKSENLIKAFYTLEKLKEYINSFIIVDNQRIAHLPNFERYYPRYNRYIASCIVDILAGVRDKTAAMNIDRLLSIISFSDEPGYAALSRASELTKGLAGYILPFLSHKPLDLRTLIRVSMEKLSIAEAPLSSERSITFLRVPEYYVREERVDKELVEEFMLMYTKECYLAVCTTKRNIAAITNLFVYRFEQLKRLRELRGLAHEAI